MIPIYAVNLVLCIVIVILGYLSYRKNRNKVSLYIGIAFGLFGISHLMTLLGIEKALTGVLIIIRTLAYLIVVFTLYKTAFKR